MAQHTSEQPPEAQRGNAENPLGVLLVVCGALLFGVLNASAVGVVLPEIAGDLDTDVGQLGWIMTGFLLVYGVAIPFYGRLADLYGARRLFILGVALFALGSLFAALATNFELLLAARLVQGLGGAAVPGLGMALASRAYGPASRGMVLGVLGATVGVGSAVGPLLGGAVSNAFDWEAIFLLNATAALLVPPALAWLPGDEDTTTGSLDLAGGLLLAVAVVGVLLAPTEASRAGLTSTWSLVGLAMAVGGFALLGWQQRRATAPFIPRELVSNRAFASFVAISFLIMAANLGALIGLPILLAQAHGLDTLEVGLVMVPGAVATGLAGLWSGRVVDSIGARTLALVGGSAMLAALVALSTTTGRDALLMSAAAGLLGGGFGLVNTPLATAVTRAVEPRLLASALGINSMLFFIGGSIGAAVLLGLATATSSSTLNPLYTTCTGVDPAAVGFSNGFLVLLLPATAVLALATRLPGPSAAEPGTAQPSSEVARPVGDWTPDCSVPWVPTLAEVADGPGSPPHRSTPRHQRSPARTVG